MTTSAVPARLSRDRLAVLVGLVAPLALAAILVPFRSDIPNTDAALAMILVVVAVAANGYRLAGILAALSVAVWFDFFLTQPYETLSITPAVDRHRDDRAAADFRYLGHRDCRLGTPPAPGREQAGGLSRRNQQRRAGCGGRGLGAGADRAGDHASSPSCSRYGRAASSAGSPGSADPRVCGTTVRSPSGSGPGTWTPRVSPPVPTPNCWWRAAACSRAGS